MKESILHGQAVLDERIPSLLRVNALARLGRAASLSIKTKRSTPRRMEYQRLRLRA